MRIRVVGFILLILLVMNGCGGGGSSSGASSFTTSGNEPVLDSDTTQKVYNVDEGHLYVTQFKAKDKSKVTYFIDGEDEKYFYINPVNGKLSFRNRPNFEEKETYNIIVIVRDIVGHETKKPITIKIQNLSEENKDITAPVFTSDTIFTINKEERIRILTSDISEVTYSLKGDGSNDFDFDTSTGILIPKELTLSTYNFTIRAKDTSGNISSQQITINVEDTSVNTVSNQTEIIDTENPIFTSSNSITVELSTQVDYSSAPSILEIQTTDDSPVTYSLDGEDKNSFYIVDNSLFFSENAIPLQKNSYNLTIYAKDIYGNQSSQPLQIAIHNDIEEDRMAPRFLSPSTVTVPYSEQTDYTTAPAILTIATDDEHATFFIEGEDAELVFLSSDEMDNNIVYFKESAIPLQKSSYSFILIARDSAGNESRQNVTINISGYEEYGNNDTPSNTEDEMGPTFLSSNSNTVPYSEQTDYSTAPEILSFQTDKEATFSIEGIDSNAVYLSIYDNKSGVVYFQESAIPLKKSSYSFILVARDSAGNESRQNVTINISGYEEYGNNDVPSDTGDKVAPTFLSSNSNTVPYSEQTDYDTAPEILSFQTDEEATFSVEGIDSNAVFLSILNDNKSGLIYFTSDAIPLQKPSYSFILIARDSAGNESHQNITINISGYEEEGNTDVNSSITSTSHVDISGYWRDELHKSYIHYNDDGTMIIYDYDDENSCYVDNSLLVKSFQWLDNNNISEIYDMPEFEGNNQTFYVERNNDILIKTTETGFSLYYYQIPPDIFFNITLCE